MGDFDDARERVCRGVAGGVIDADGDALSVAVAPPRAGEGVPPAPPARAVLLTLALGRAGVALLKAADGVAGRWPGARDGGVETGAGSVGGGAQRMVRATGLTKNLQNRPLPVFE